MKKIISFCILICIAVLITYSCYYKSNPRFAGQADSIEIKVPKTSQQRIERLQQQIHQLNNQEWIKAQQSSIKEKIAQLTDPAWIRNQQYILRLQLQKTYDANWLKEQQTILEGQANTIYETLVHANENIDPDRIDWSKSKLQNGSIIVHLKPRPKSPE